MKALTKKLLSLLLCAALALGVILPAFADEPSAIEPTWQNVIESVTPVGGEPSVKLKLTPEGYKIVECTVPERYDVRFKDGTSTSVTRPDEPSHVIPLFVYEYYFDVETPEGVVTLYAGVRYYTDVKEAYFCVGQYVLDGTLGEDGVPVAGSMEYHFSISEEPCKAEKDEGKLITRILYFLYTCYLKVQKWFVLHFHKK